MISRVVVSLSIALVIPSMAPAPLVMTDIPEPGPVGVSMFTCAECHHCWMTDSKVGDIISTEPEMVEWAIVSYCPNGWPGSCGEMEPCGAQQQEDAEELQLATQEWDAQRVVELLTPPHVVLVPERSAIQVMDCHGDHVAYHVSLDPTLFATVTDLQQEEQ